LSFGNLVLSRYAAAAKEELKISSCGVQRAGSVSGEQATLAEKQQGAPP
jgi:hypothetical protein